MHVYNNMYMHTYAVFVDNQVLKRVRSALAKGDKQDHEGLGGTIRQGATSRFQHKGITSK